MIFKRQIDALKQFVESVRYRDFSRHFNTAHGSRNTKLTNKYFNEVMQMFRTISREKESQNQYLQKIMEMVDTGILSYEESSGEVGLMNESLKKLVQIPYIKTIHGLERRNHVLYEELVNLKAGANKIIEITTERPALRILLSATQFREDGKIYKLIAFQNIRGALEETETQAWQKLLRVLTHEIMNSVTPISSLAGTLQSGIKDGMAAEDIITGMETIKNRSNGLLQFAETYRNLSKITSIRIQHILVRDLFENLLRLLQPMMDNENIDIDIVLSDTELEIDADLHLIEQVLINLLKNAMDAVKGKHGAKIILAGTVDAFGKPVLRVSDNGVGIAPDVLEQIFVPFFTTKKSGTGIGLSLCRQIMALHKGTIQVQSVYGEGTSFWLQF
jgi:two-component system, NtrC family, nitrogen regulation sensor histidine kinase NtrY